MASTGKLESEVEVKSSAEKVWESLKDCAKVFSLAFPERYETIEVIEGDGKSPGSILRSIYQEGLSFPPTTVRIDMVDEANKLISYTMLEGRIMVFYNKFEPNLQVVPQGGGALIKWSADFQKANENAPDPHAVAENLATRFKDLDVFLLNA